MLGYRSRVVVYPATKWQAISAHTLNTTLVAWHLILPVHRIGESHPNSLAFYNLILSTHYPVFYAGSSLDNNRSLIDSSRRPRIYRCPDKTPNNQSSCQLCTARMTVTFMIVRMIPAVSMVVMMMTSKSD